ncbi:MAG: CBS domain-containing protein [Spirosomataceae bacterium]
MITVQTLLKNKHHQTVISVRPDSTVIEALEVMAEKNIGAVVVMEGDNLVGIFSERDYARKGIIKGRKAKDTLMSEVMTPNVYTVDYKMNINDCMKIMSEKKFRHLPVLQEGKVMGVLSVGDIVEAIFKEQLSHIAYLERYIAGS